MTWLGWLVFQTPNLPRPLSEFRTKYRYENIGAEANRSTFENFVVAQSLFGPFAAKHKPVMDGVNLLYSTVQGDGSWPHGQNLPNKTFSHFYWAAKHMLADSEQLCPARAAVTILTAHGAKGYQFVFRHPSMQTACATSNIGCMAQGSPHASGIPFWFREHTYTLSSSGALWWSLVCPAMRQARSR